MAMLPPVDDPALLVGSDTLDDAAVYRLNDEIALDPSPLQLEGELLERHAQLARLGSPVCVYSMPLAGATAPVTVAGTATLGLGQLTWSADGWPIAGNNPAATTDTH